MLSGYLLSLLLALPPQPQVDTTAVYSVVLQQLRSEHPGGPILLSETWADLHCRVYCADTVQTSGPHRRVIEELRLKGLVDGSCHPSAGSCATAGSAHGFVALSPIGTERVGIPPHLGFTEWPLQPGDVWVLVHKSIPCRQSACHADTLAWLFLLRPGPDGSWAVHRRVLVAVV